MAEAQVLEEYYVSEACIACDACCNDFPDIFIMNADHTRAKAVNPSPVGKFNPWDIITDCPVDAISLVNLPMPPKPAGMEKKKEEAPAELGDWRQRWEAARNIPESQWERMKRYGMATSISDEGNRYVLRFDMPEKIPNHELKYKWGLPDRMPDYAYSVELTEGRRVKVRAKLEDEKVKKLSGWLNSFPMGFLKEVILDEAVKSHQEKYDSENKMLEITLEKVGS